MGTRTGHESRTPVPAIVVAGFAHKDTAGIAVPTGPMLVATERGFFELTSPPKCGREDDVHQVVSRLSMSSDIGAADDRIMSARRSFPTRAELTASSETCCRRREPFCRSLSNRIGLGSARSEHIPKGTATTVETHNRRSQTCRALRRRDRGGRRVSKFRSPKRRTCLPPGRIDTSRSNTPLRPIVRSVPRCVCQPVSLSVPKVGQPLTCSSSPSNGSGMNSAASSST
jgi:hypothetical protein